MTNKDRLDFIFIGYVLKADTDFALLLNGDWGSGKTYYLKHHLFPKIEKLDGEYKPLYVSVFGAKSVADVNRKILVALLPILGSKGVKALASIGKIFLGYKGITSEEADTDNFIDLFARVDQKTVLVFDDLERLDYEHLVEILGFINQLTEHTHAKVIITANENEIMSGDTDNYKRYIEKLVRHKIEFNLDFNEISNELLNNSNISNEHKRTILDAFEVANCRNLRTLQFVVALAVDILSTIEKIKVSHDTMKHEIAGHAIYFLSALSIEAKSKSLSRETMTELREFSLEKPLSFALLSAQRNPLGKKASDDVVKSDEEMFVSRYFAYGRLYYFESLVVFLNTGFLNADLFKEEFRRFEEYQVAKGGSIWDQKFTQLSEYNKLDDGETIGVLNEVLDFAETGAYHLLGYMQIFYVAEFLIVRKIVRYNRKRLVRQLKAGINNCRDKIPTSHIKQFTKLSSEPSEDEKMLYNEMMEKNEELLRASNVSSANSHLDQMFTNPFSYSREVLHNKDSVIPALHFCGSTSDFIKRYLLLKNHDKAMFNSMFYEREVGIIDQREVEWLTDLRSRLNRIHAGKKGMLNNSIVNVQQLEGEVERSIENMANLLR